MEEIWKPIPGYEGLYEVSSLGRVKSLARDKKSGARGHQRYPERMLKPFFDGKHLRARLSKDKKTKSVFIHRIMAAAFLGGSLEFDKEHLVCHKNDIGTDNRLENLYIGTYSDNNTDTVRNGHGVDNSNENHGNCRLKNEEVLEIRRLVRGGMMQKDAAKLYGIDASYVSRLMHDLNRRKL